MVDLTQYLPILIFVVIAVGLSAAFVFLPMGVARLTGAMAEEGRAILDEGIATRPADIDLVEVHGYGYPRWRGGPMRLADEWGLPALLADYEALTAEDPKSWAVPALIRRLVAEGRSFADLNA